MDKIRIAVFAALPQEISSLRRIVRPWTATGREPFPRFCHFEPDRDFILIETGMGHKAIVDALRWEIRRKAPDLILSVGFAGSLSAKIVVGDVLLVDQWLEWSAPDDSTTRQTASSASMSAGLSLDPAPDLIRFCESAGAGTARIVTVQRPESKQAMSAHFPTPPTIMDMESGVAAWLAEEAKIPLLCFRAVSDGLEHEIDFDVDDISDCSGKVRISKVAAALARRPRLLVSLAVCASRSSRAARKLGQALKSFLYLPHDELVAIIQSSRIRRAVNSEQLTVNRTTTW